MTALYEIANAKPAWLAKLRQSFHISDEDEAYLIWLDDYEGRLKRQLKQMTVADAMDPRLDYSRINSRIRALEHEADRYSGEDRFMFLGLSEIDDLMAQRWKWRNAILDAELPDRPNRLRESDIEQARSVPLERLIRNLPRSRKIACPYHKDKTPSFHVYQRGYCFGCGILIDSIQWQMDQLGKSFSEAVRSLFAVR